MSLCWGLQYFRTHLTQIESIFLLNKGLKPLARTTEVRKVSLEVANQSHPQSLQWSLEG
jgi:hypothetical protein